MRLDAIVLGGGAAGLYCATHAARRGRRVLLLEHNPRPGHKIELSGGGRCNFTHLGASAETYISSNPRFALSALRRHGPADFLAFFKELGLSYVEKSAGQLFCREGAAVLAARLAQAAQHAGATLRLGCAVQAVERAGEGGYRVRTSQGPFAAGRVVVATGGLSVPKVGASGLGYQIAAAFGLARVPCRPGLVPLTFSDTDRARWPGLQGVALPVRVGCGKQAFEDSLLFTHKGLSGPAILQISNYWREGQPLTIDWLPGHDTRAWLEANRQRPLKLSNLLAEVFPQRLARVWAAAMAQDKPLNQFSPKPLAALHAALQAGILTPAGTEGYAKAEVTLGGVDTRELSPQTLEAKRAPGLYFIGEVVDVTGHLGGYNFQWAWSSAHATAQAV